MKKLFLYLAFFVALTAGAQQGTVATFSGSVKPGGYVDIRVYGNSNADPLTNPVSISGNIKQGGSVQTYTVGNNPLDSLVSKVQAFLDSVRNGSYNGPRDSSANTGGGQYQRAEEVPVKATADLTKKIFTITDKVTNPKVWVQGKRVFTGYTVKVSESGTAIVFSKAQTATAAADVWVELLKVVR